MNFAKVPQANRPGDTDPEETGEWLAALESVVQAAGEDRAEFLLSALDRKARELGVGTDLAPCLPYRNSIPLERQPPFPGDIVMEERITAIIRWNASPWWFAQTRPMANSAAILRATFRSRDFETGFNHFFHAATGSDDGDLVFFQPHSAPGVYARLSRRRLSEEQLKRYRQEVNGGGLSSIPIRGSCPISGRRRLARWASVRLRRSTGSFLRYLQHRGLANTQTRHVWGVFGDGEMDEPESIAGLSLAAREKLDNLTFVINCNLQRLDGPVRGNGQIIPELESLFRGAGWNVIKVLWGSEWDALFARDKKHALLRRFAATVDGKYQTLGARDGGYNLLHFFDKDPEVHDLVAHMSDGEIDGLKRGGHDLRKLFAAFELARATKDNPTVILAKTKKGYGMGGAGESRMTSHQAKKLDIDALIAFRDRFALQIAGLREPVQPAITGRSFAIFARGAMPLVVICPRGAGALRV
jgi:pyruvate dehydrogenase E1 component